jgi:hypothetical protein
LNKTARYTEGGVWRTFYVVAAWLEQVPFLQFEGFDFLENYRLAVGNMLATEQANILNSNYLNEEEQQMRLLMLGATDSYFQSIFDEKNHEQAIAEGKLRLSYRATISRGSAFCKIASKT